VRRIREAAAAKVTVRWAVNGTMPNGSDLQPLAGPSDLRLDLDQERALNAFTHAAWSACEVREARYFAFFPLDDGGDLWSLSRVSRLGRGARGWVLVAWSALIARDALDAIAWPVHRLLPTAFPEAHVPTRGEQYAPVQVDLAPASTPATDPWRPAMDALVAGLGRRPPRIALRIAPPLTAEAAIFALWSRLGKRREELSFCTWSGIESGAYPPPDRPFHVVVADGDAEVQARPGRVERVLASAPGPRPSLAAEVVAYLDGVEFPPRDALSVDPAADAAEVGARLFESFGEALAGDARATFARLAEELRALDASFAPARAGLFDLLALAATSAPQGPPRAQLIGDFQAGAAALVADDPLALPRIAAAAVRADAVAFLAPDQWRSLAPALFEPALWPSVLRSLASAPPAPVAWGAILAVAPAGAAAAPLLRLAAARAWDDPAGQAAFERLMALGHDAVTALLDDPHVPARVRGLALARLCRARARPRAGLVAVVAYQRYCLWLHRQAHAAPALQVTA
jgi:hypothetical protein